MMEFGIGMGMGMGRRERNEPPINPVDFVQTIDSIEPNSERFQSRPSPTKNSPKEKSPQTEKKAVMVEE